MTHLAIARIVAPRGLHGEVKAQILTDFPERFAATRRVCLGEAKAAWDVERARVHRGVLLLKLRGCDSRSQAERLRGQLVQVPVEEAVPLPEGHFFWHQIIGLEARTPAGEVLGQVNDILPGPANDVYVLQGARGQVLIPAVEEVILQVDLDRGLLLVQLPQGLV